MTDKMKICNNREKSAIAMVKQVNKTVRLEKDSSFLGREISTIREINVHFYESLKTN